MRSIHKRYRSGLIATAFLLAAGWPSAALAQGHAHGGHAHEGGDGELLLIGEVSIGAGQLTLKSEEGEPKEMTVFGDAALFAAGRKGAFAGRVEIGFHTEGAGHDDEEDGEDDDHKLAAVEHDLRWEIGPRVHLVLSGNALADTLGSARGNVSVTNAPDGALGNREVHLGFEEVGLVGVEFPLGAITLGLAIADRCLPQCGFGRDAGEETHPEAERRAVVPHLRGQVGAWQYNAYLASSSGTFQDTRATGKGSAAGAGLFYDGQRWTAGLDVLGSKVECNTVAGPNPCADDEKVSAWGVAFTVGGFGVHYVAHETKVGAEKDEETNLDAVYLFDVGGVVVGPEYRRVTEHGQDGAPDVTDSLLLFGISMEF